MHDRDIVTSQLDGKPIPVLNLQSHRLDGEEAYVILTVSSKVAIHIAGRILILIR